MTMEELIVASDQEHVLCDTCGEVPATETHLENRIQPVKLRQGSVEVEGPTRICNHCQNKVYDRDLDDSLLQKAFFKSREIHHLLTPEEIRSIREKYALSQRGLAALLGLGEITIHRYENGSLPDEAQNQLLRLIADPLNMRRLLLQNWHRLPPAARERTEARVNEILKEKSVEIATEALQAGISAMEAPTSRKKSIIRIPGRVTDPFLRTGGRTFSAEILMDMILFFAGKPGGVLKTKVNKLLWYADFEHFRRFGVSISGSVYVHETFGPVAHGYWLYFAKLAEENKLDVQELTYDNSDWVAELLIATAKPQATWPISVNEVMEAVHRRFMTTGSRAISEISHRERAYFETDTKQEISYSYARDLIEKF